MAQNNGFPAHLIHRIKRQLMGKKKGTTTNTSNATTQQEMGHLYVPQPPQYARLATCSKEPT